MQSIPQAMTWEVLSRGRWALAAATVGAVALPMLILLALRSTGPLDSLEPAIVTMHYSFTLFNALFFCVAILHAQGPLARMVALPLRSTTLVAWRMLPAMLIIAVQSLSTTLVLNGLFDLNWPLLGPALFLAVTIAWANAICWMLDKSLGWQVFTLSVAAVALSTWFQWRDGFGPSFGSSAIRYWYEVTIADAFTMCVLIVGAYYVALAGVARNRCGEPPVSFGILNWLARKFSARRVAMRRSATASQAYFRNEWQRKGWVMPIAVLFGLALFGVGWLLLSRDPNDLMVGFLVGGSWLTLAGILGGIPMGNTGRNDSNDTMRQFTAALPISDQAMARNTLRATAASAFSAWLLWAVAFAIGYATVIANGADDSVDYPTGHEWWLYFAATSLGIWSAASIVTAMGLTGRGKLWLKAVVALFSVIVLINLVSNLTLSPEGVDFVIQLLFATIFLAIVLTTIGMFVVARNRRLIESALTWLVVVAAVIVAVLAAILWPRHLNPYWIAELMIAAVYSLAVAPLAAFPLAISANRHR